MVIREHLIILDKICLSKSSQQNNASIYTEQISYGDLFNFCLILCLCLST